MASPTTQSYTATVNGADWTTSTRDNGLVTAYRYDAAGQQRARTIVNANSPATTVLDAEWRATSIGESVGGTGPYTSTYGYNPTDLPITASLPGGTGVAENGGYDANSRLITLTVSGPSTATTPLTSTYAYGYNPLGWTTGVTPTVSGVVSPTALTHDVLGRVTQTAGPPGEQWVSQTSGVTASLKGVACPSTSTCIAVGDGGVIRASTDGGVTWSGQSSGTTNNLTAISCPNTTTCFVAGYGGTILATTNGGTTWTAQNPGTTFNLKSVSCPSTTTCYAVGDGGKLSKTTNGSTWALGSSGTSTNLWGVSCASPTACTAVGHAGAILGTTDGSTWSSQSGPVSYDLRADWCPSTMVCYAVGITGTIETTNGGGELGAGQQRDHAVLRGDHVPQRQPVPGHREQRHPARHLQRRHDLGGAEQRDLQLLAGGVVRGHEHLRGGGRCRHHPDQQRAGPLYLQRQPADQQHLRPDHDLRLQRGDHAQPGADPDRARPKE